MIRAGKLLERTDLLPDKSRKIVVAQQRDGRLQRVTPKRESLRTHCDACYITRRKSSRKIRQTLQRFPQSLSAYVSCERNIIRERHATTVSIDPFEQLKAEERSCPESTDSSSSISRANRLRTIFYDNEIILLGDLHHLAHPAR